MSIIKIEPVRPDAIFTTELKMVGTSLQVVFPNYLSELLNVIETDTVTLAVIDYVNDKTKEVIIKGKYDKESKSYKKARLILNRSDIRLNFPISVEFKEDMIDKLAEMITNKASKVNIKINSHELSGEIRKVFGSEIIKKTTLKLDFEIGG